MKEKLEKLEKVLNFKMPKPRDNNEAKLYLSAKLAAESIYDEKEIDEVDAQEFKDKIWNIYFWNIFKYRAKKVNCSKTTVKWSKINIVRHF